MQENLRNWTNKYGRFARMQMTSAIILFILMSFFEKNYGRIMLFPMFIFSILNFIAYKVIDEEYFGKKENVNFISGLQLDIVLSFGSLFYLYVIYSHEVEEHLIIRLIYFVYCIFFHLIQPCILLKEFKSLTINKEF